jgi:hypothetical protein
VGLAAPDSPGRVPLPLGFGRYGIYSTWFCTLLELGTAVVFFSNILEAHMNLPLFCQMVWVTKGKLLGS